jgi:L-fucose isomerase-like protein
MTDHTPNAARPRIGFVSVTRPAFKGDTGAARRRSLDGLAALADAWDFELIVSEEAVADADQAERVARTLRSRELDYLLIQLTTFATGEVPAPLLRGARQVGLWALPERAGGGNGRGPLPLNSLCGVTMALSTLEHPAVDRRGPVKWFYGEVRDHAFERRLAATVGALRGLGALRGARVLAIGGTAPNFYGLEETPDALAEGSVGVRVVRRELAELFHRVAAVPEAQARARARAWAEREASDVSEAQLERAARVDVALAAMAAESDAQALAVRCWPELPDACGTMACAAMGDRSGAHVPAACEGDVMGAVSMLALQGVSGAPALLMDISDVDEDSGSLQLWHCGNGPVAWAAPASDGASGTRLTTHFNRDGVGVVRDMRLAPGPVTGLRLLSGGRAAVVTGGTVLSRQPAGFDGVRGFVGDLRWADRHVDVHGFIANLLDRRLPHHLALGRGEHHDAVMEMCALLGAGVLPALEPRPYLRT